MVRITAPWRDSRSGPAFDHLVGRAVAQGLAAVPSLGMRLAHGREYPRDSIDVFFIVAAEDGDELTGVKVCGADRKSAVEIAEELERRTSAIATGADQEFGRAKQMLTVLPPRVLRQALKLSAWLSSDLHLDLPVLGVRKEAFGGAMVTSVGRHRGTSSTATVKLSARPAFPGDGV